MKAFLNLISLAAIGASYYWTWGHDRVRALLVWAVAIFAQIAEGQWKK